MLKHHRSTRQTVLFGLFLLLSQPVLADHISDLLEKMSAADKRLNYQGVFVLRKADNLITMRVNHTADADGVRESLEFMNGEARHVIRNNDEVISIYPDRKIYTVTETKQKTGLHPALPQNLDKLQSYYEIERLDDDRIADHKTAVIKLHPKDSNRYGYRYWVDKDTGVLLRCDLVADDDKVIEQMMFTQLEYKDSLPASKFDYPGLDDFEKRLLGKDRTITPDVGWQVSELPAGFMLTQSSTRKKDNSTALHLVYSDGLASVSVFIEYGQQGHKYLKGATAMGALNAYGVKNDDYYITVMGEVPESTVQQIALSTRLGSGNHQ